MRKEMNKHTTKNDFKNKAFLKDVIRQCQNGDTDAMEKVYTGYKTSIFSIAYRFAGNHASAEDLLHDIFINVFKHIDKLRSPEAFNSWVYRIAINTCMSFARKREKIKEISMDDINPEDFSDNSHHPNHHHLEKAIKKLPAKQKSVFLLHDVTGFTHTEIAKIMKLSAGTSKSQLFKARMKIREYLKEGTS